MKTYKKKKEKEEKYLILRKYQRKNFVLEEGEN